MEGERKEERRIEEWKKGWKDRWMERKMDGKTDKGVEGRRRESGRKGKEKDGGRLILDLLGLPCLYLFPFYFQNLSGTL